MKASQYKDESRTEIIEDYINDAFLYWSEIEANTIEEADEEV